MTWTGAPGLGPPRRGIFRYGPVVEKGHLWIRGEMMPTLGTSEYVPVLDEGCQASRSGTPHWLDHRLQVGVDAIRGGRDAPGPTANSQLGVRVRQRQPGVVHAAGVDGICLALVYVPSASEAYPSLLVLNFEQPLGWFLRAMHGWGSNFMVAIVLLHMVQVLLFGAYKYPRELTWLAASFSC